jgi:2-dehydropantoate 2-reductase
MAFENPKVVVIGAGAMGGLFGGLLAEGGLDVTLVDTWGDHISTIASKGLRIVGVGGNRAIPIKATGDVGTVKAADVVLFQCKSFANEERCQGRQAPVYWPAGGHQLPERPR